MDTPGGQNWLRLVRYAENEFSRPDSLVKTVPAVRQQLEQTLMTAFLLSHSHNFSELLRKPQAAAAPYYVKRAEEYIEQYFSEPISLADIAAYAGVSARSLQNGFQNFRGMTPMAFLRTTRLRHAHRQLAAADPKTTRGDRHRDGRRLRPHGRICVAP